MCKGDVDDEKGDNIHDDCNNFQTWHLICWQHSRQPFRCQVWKSLLTHMDFNMEVF